MEPPKEHEHLAHVANAWLDTLDIPLEKRVEMDEHLTTMAKDAMDTREKPEGDEKHGEDTENQKDEENEDNEEAQDENMENNEAQEAQLQPDAVPPVVPDVGTEAEEDPPEDLPELKPPLPSPSQARRQATGATSGGKDDENVGENDGEKGTEGGKGSFKYTHRAGASNASKIRITVHVNGQQLQQLPGHLPDFLPRGSVAQQMGPQSLPRPRIRPTRSLSAPSMPSVLPSSQSKKKRNRKRKKNKNDKNDKNKKDQERDFDYQDHWREATPFKESRPRIAPSQAPQKSSPQVTKVLQSTPKMLPRPRDRTRAKDKEDFIQVIRERLRSLPGRPRPTSVTSVEADDQPSKVAKVEPDDDAYDEYDGDTYVKQEMKEELDEDW